ncbi:MAG: nucleoside hydrolase [Acidobacteriota bacterium]
MVRILALAALLLWSLLPRTAAAHGGPLPLIVDTDLAADDVRALAFLLASPAVRVEAVVTSGEGRSPEISAHRILQILEHLDRSGIPVGAGNPVDGPPPPWRTVVDSLAWPSLAPARGVPERAADVLARSLSGSEHGVTYLCLGPTTNLAALLRDEPILCRRIREVWFYGSAPGRDEACWNRDADLEAARRVFASDLPIRTIRLEEDETFPFDEGLLTGLERASTPSARLLATLFGAPGPREKVRQGHFRSWDEAVALCAAHPDLAAFAPTQTGTGRTLLRWDRDAGRALWLQVVAGDGRKRMSETSPVGLSAFPASPDQFRPDLKGSVPRILARHGGEEWRAAVLTNELHGHVGTYSLVGVKMGILARERLGAALDEVEVLSFAGDSPPLSCMNDGLQVSTGATLGRGTIRVDGGGGARPEAEFIRGGERLRLRLKESVRLRIDSDIREALRRYGNLTPEYFREIRRLSILHWEELDRAEIFEEVPAQ